MQEWKINWSDFLDVVLYSKGGSSLKKKKKGKERKEKKIETKISPLLAAPTRVIAVDDR